MLATILASFSVRSCTQLRGRMGSDKVHLTYMYLPAKHGGGYGPLKVRVACFGSAELLARCLYHCCIGRKSGYQYWITCTSHKFVVVIYDQPARPGDNGTYWGTCLKSDLRCSGLRHRCETTGVSTHEVSDATLVVVLLIWRSARSTGNHMNCHD